MKTHLGSLFGGVLITLALGLSVLAFFTTHWYEYRSENVQTAERMLYYRGLWEACFEHEISRTLALDTVCQSFGQIQGSLTRQMKAIIVMAIISLVVQVLSVILVSAYLYILHRLLDQQRMIAQVVVLLQGQSALFTFIAVGLYGRWLDLTVPQIPESISYVNINDGLSWSFILAVISGSLNLLSSISFLLELKRTSSNNDPKPSSGIERLIQATRYKSLPQMIEDDGAA